jgi:hypothetical protein
MNEAAGTALRFDTLGAAALLALQAASAPPSIATPAVATPQAVEKRCPGCSKLSGDFNRPKKSTTKYLDHCPECRATLLRNERIKAKRAQATAEMKQKHLVRAQLRAWAARAGLTLCLARVAKQAQRQALRMKQFPNRVPRTQKAAAKAVHAVQVDAVTGAPDVAGAFQAAP